MAVGGHDEIREGNWWTWLFASIAHIFLFLCIFFKGEFALFDLSGGYSNQEQKEYEDILQETYPNLRVTWQNSGCIFWEKTSPNLTHQPKILQLLRSGSSPMSSRRCWHFNWFKHFSNLFFWRGWIASTFFLAAVCSYLDRQLLRRHRNCCPLES